MFAWLRELYEIRRENKHCESCETLKMQLAVSNEEKQKLLELVIQQNTPKVEVPNTTSEFKPLKTTQYTPWSVRKQMLEAEDRRAAQIIRERDKETESIEDLEKELEINES